MNDTTQNDTTIDVIDETLAPLWQAIDRLEAEWREKNLAQAVDDASDLLREATDMAVEVIQNPTGDIDDARGALTNRLKGLLDDARFVRLCPSVAFARSEPEAVFTSLALPEALKAPLDVTLLVTQDGDALDDRIYKLWRRFALKVGLAPRRLGNVIRRWRDRPERTLPVQLRTIWLDSVGQTHLQTGLPMEAALVHRFEISAITVQALRRLWDVFLKEYTGNQEADHQVLEQVCEEALIALVARGELAEKEMAACFETLRIALRDSIDRIDAPWNVYARAFRLYFGKLRLQKRYGNLEKDWERLYRGMLGSFDLGLEIASFEYEATEYVEDIRERVSHHVEKSLVTPLTWMEERCQSDSQEAQRLFNSIKKGVEDQDAALFAQAIETLQDQLEALVTNLSTGYTVHTMQQIDRGRTVSQGREELTLFAEASVNLMRQVGGDCDFWVGEPPQWSVGDLPPESETLRVPVRELVRPLVEKEVQPELDALRQRLADLYVHTQTVLQDIWKVIRFNVESGIAEMDGDTTDRRQLLNTAEEIVVGGLDRAGSRVSALIDEVKAVTDAVDAGMLETVTEAIEKVEKSLQPGSGLDVRLRRLTHLAKSRAEGYAEIGEGVGSALLRRLKYAHKWIMDQGQAGVVYVRRMLGLTPVALHEAQTIIDEADLSNTKLERLPSIYRRLFRMVPLQTEDFLVARANELNTMREAVSRWEKNRPSALALVGEVGTGKTTLINCATPKLFNKYQVYRHAFDGTVNTEADLARIMCSLLGIEKTISLDELAQYFMARETPCVVLLEHGYELFMRRIGGLEVIRGLLQLISATSRKVFWCLSMTESAWRYLDAVVEISEYFSYIIETRNLVGDELAKVIMARHEVSGYGLLFASENTPSVLRRLKKTGDEKAKQKVLRDIFFERLSDASKGNVQIALFYWLRSIIEIKDDTVYVELLKPFRFAFLNQLSVDKLFTLAAVLQQGTLTVREHMEVFRSSESVSEGMMATLASDNLIQIRPGVDEGGDVRYMINPVMRRPLVDLLWNRHIFY